MLKPYIKKVVEGGDLSRKEAREAMGIIMSGQSTDAQIACYITALRMKGETVDEITGSAEAMREKAARLSVKRTLKTNIDADDTGFDGGVIVDTCGTGGDGSDTFNISTTAAFVTAGAGVTVAKHGNRSVSSRCGSADVLKELGVNIELAPAAVKKCIERIGIGFMFAPMFHSAMKYAIGPRRETGIRTVFNVLGPLTNPAGANTQVLGVYRPELTTVMAGVLQRLGAKAAMVVHGDGCYDEITTTGATRITQLKNGKLRTYSITPEDFGIKKVAAKALKGGDAARNAEITRAVLSGKKGAARDVTLLNAAAALVVAGKAKGFPAGLRLAAESVDSGAAKRKLELLARESAG